MRKWIEMDFSIRVTAEDSNIVLHGDLELSTLHRKGDFPHDENLHP